MSLDPKKEKANVTKDVVQDSEQVAPPVDKTVSGVSEAAKTMTIVRSSKFRHIEGKFRHRSTFISKIPSLSSTVPGDSNAFQVNYYFVVMIKPLA